MAKSISTLLMRILVTTVGGLLHVERGVMTAAQQPAVDEMPAGHVVLIGVKSLHGRVFLQRS